MKKDRDQMLVILLSLGLDARPGDMAPEGVGLESSYANLKESIYVSVGEFCEGFNVNLGDDDGWFYDMAENFGWSVDWYRPVDFVLLKKSEPILDLHSQYFCISKPILIY